MSYISKDGTTGKEISSVVEKAAEFHDLHKVKRSTVYETQTQVYIYKMNLHLSGAQFMRLLTLAGNVQLNFIHDGHREVAYRGIRIRKRSPSWYGNCSISVRVALPG